MENSKFDELKNNVQEIIDLISSGETKGANDKLTEVGELLDELIDHAEEDDELREISRYQVLLNQLHQKLNASQS